MPVNKKAIEDIKNIYIETIAMGNLQRFFISNSNLYPLFNSTIIDFCNFISIPYQLLPGQKTLSCQTDLPRIYQYAFVFRMNDEFRIVYPLEIQPVDFINI